VSAEAIVLKALRLPQTQFLVDAVHFYLKVNFALVLDVFTLVFNNVHKTEFHVVLVFKVLILQNCRFTYVKRLINFVF
jgi:hypothetical protein